MKRRLFCVLLALMLTIPALAEEAQPDGAYAELIRLHVLAEDDSEQAQSLKLKVRDAILATTQTLLADCESADEAYEIINEALPELEAAAAECLRANGSEISVRAETGVFAFPDREYDGVTVPAGDYRALRIVLGEGEGQNWWCVLYPSLCLPSEAGYPSLLAEWFRRWFGGGV